MQSEKIQNFTNDFNNNFGEYLWPMPEANIDPGSESVKSLNIYVPTKKYSDWDIHCYLKPEFRIEKIIKQFENFILSYTGLLNPTVIVCKNPKLAGVWQHINNMTALQVMAFIENETYAPFFDFTLFFDNNELVKTIYSSYPDEGAINWLFFTAWRKLKNIDPQKYLGLSCNYLAPMVTQESESELFLNDPNKFFKVKFEDGRYKEIVRFLGK